MEDILVPLIVFGFIALIVKMALDFARWKKMHSGGALAEGKADNSLGTTELKMLIQEAVQNANQPLLDRIEHLEGELIQERANLPESTPLKQLTEPAPGARD